MISRISSSHTISIFFLSLLLSHTQPTHTGLLTRAAVALEHSYQAVTNGVKNKYAQATESLKPELATWDWYAIDVTRQTRSMAFPATFYIISLDWQEIEPRELVYNHQKIQEYAQLCQELKNNQITPVINLFDGNSTPDWFTGKGGFTNYHALPAFTHYAQTVFKALASHANFWITANNPAEYASNLFVTSPASDTPANIQTPHKRGDFAGMLTTLEHMLIAHRDSYAAIKRLPGGAQARIGIGLATDPILSANSMNPLLGMKAEKLTRALQDAMRNMLNNNRMAVDIEGTSKDNYIHSIDGAFDFLVLNYTAPRYLEGNYKLGLAPVSYPEGLYFAIKTVSESMRRSVPLLINHSLISNSIARAGMGTEDERMAAQRHLYALNKAVKEGYRVMGYIHATVEAKVENMPTQSQNQAPANPSAPTPKK
jgi:beta-glucosidase/6-phospho-beta-glucosidase/beta-galactosidase